MRTMDCVIASLVIGAWNFMACADENRAQTCLDEQCQHDDSTDISFPNVDMGADASGPDGNVDTGVGDTSTDIAPGPEGPCDVLIRNEGLPGVYPPVFRQPEGATALFEQQSNELLSAYGLTHDNYSMEGVPVSWTPHISHQAGDSIVLSSGTEEITPASAHELIWPFIERWSALLKTAGTELEEEGWCDNGQEHFATCTVTYHQEFCGLEIESNGSYSGRLQVQIERRHSDDIILRNLTSSLIPLHTVYLNPSLDHEAAVRSIIGTEYTYMCWDETTMTFTDDLSYEVADDLVLFVLLADDETGLEYRTAYQVSVGIQWIIWVDAFDGSVLRVSEQFDC